MIPKEIRDMSIGEIGQGLQQQVVALERNARKALDIIAPSGFRGRMRMMAVRRLPFLRGRLVNDPFAHLREDFRGTGLGLHLGLTKMRPALEHMVDHQATLVGLIEKVEDNPEDGETHEGIRSLLRDNARKTMGVPGKEEDAIDTTLFIDKYVEGTTHEEIAQRRQELLQEARELAAIREHGAEVAKLLMVGMARQYDQTLGSYNMLLEAGPILDVLYRNTRLSREAWEKNKSVRGIIAHQLLESVKIAGQAIEGVNLVRQFDEAETAPILLQVRQEAEKILKNAAPQLSPPPDQSGS